MPKTPKSKKIKPKRRPSASLYAPVCFTDYLDSLDKENLQGVLHELWQNWSFIKQKAKIPFGEPLGHKKMTLIMGCDDSIEMQELRMHEQAILKAVNDFLGSTVFKKLRVDLKLDKPSVTQAQSLREQTLKHDQQPDHQAMGTYLKDMDPNSAIARCYAKYLKKPAIDEELTH